MSKTQAWRRGRYLIIISTIFFLPLIFLYIFSPDLFKDSINVAPWAMVTEPYFEVGMGYVYKETTMEEAQQSVNFKVFKPFYRPSGKPIYRVAINVKPKAIANSEVYFFTPNFPGTEPGTEPFGGLLIKQSLTEEKELPKNTAKLIIDSTEVSFFSLSPQDGLGFYFKEEETNIVGSWFDKDADQSELFKIAESIITKRAEQILE
ncbi:MAG: hypothetical protein ACD_11C00158G0002 [uncultured bacterium]|nr:MAG: hypothetical protein ACD_11C00158G0002 [uncultured bacterium]